MLFSCLTVPLQRFLGFLYTSSSSSSEFILSNSVKVIIPSPLRFSSPLKFILPGRFLKYLALCVISSPTSPFPLVTALSRTPLLYVKTIVSPSSFQLIIPSLSPSQLINLSGSLVLSSDSIGLSCLTFCRELKTV